MELIINNEYYPILSNPIVQTRKCRLDPLLPNQFKDYEESFEITRSYLESNKLPYNYYKVDSYFGKLIIILHSKYTAALLDIYK